MLFTSTRWSQRQWQSEYWFSAEIPKRYFSNRLAEEYANAAREKYDVRLHMLHEMDFNPDLVAGYDGEQKLEASLDGFQDSISWADHLVIVTPIWWGAVPAKLKGLIDRTFLPGFAFRYENGKSTPRKLLNGKTSRIIMTMDTPPWYYRFIQGSPALKQLKTTTLEFCGFTSVKSNMWGPINSSNKITRANWVKKVAVLGKSAK